jgi:hypothetical protein
MNIQNALAKVAQGDAITRTGWSDPARRIDVSSTPFGEVLGMPYTVDGDGVPLFLTVEDLQAVDWAVVE